MADKKDRSSTELIKEASHQLRGTIRDELAGDSDRFSETDLQLLKFHGTYQQDDRDLRKQRKKEGLDKYYIFMVRSKIPGGKVTADQYLAEDDLADRYGNGTVRITTRQGFQLHGVVKRNLRATIRGINEALLSTLGACGDVERNVICCPAPHHGDRVHDRIQATADEIARHLAPRTRAYHEIWLNGEQVVGPPDDATIEPIYKDVYLPRKFKTGIGLADDNCIDVYANDCGLLAVVEAGALIGFNVLVGGSMGTTPSNANTFPMLGRRMAFCTPEQVLDVVTGVAKVHRDYSNRADRKRARIKYVVADRGIEWVRARVEEYIGSRLADCHPADVHGYCDHLGWNAQGDGKFYMGIPVENGRIKDEGALRLKTGLRTIIRRFRTPVRLTTQQDILICDLEPDQKVEIERLMAEHGIRRVQQITTVRRLAMACPALPTCGLAITESERIMPEIVAAVEAELARLGLDTERLTVRMTGCPNGCARPYTADLGIVGRTVGKYTIFLGGSLLGTRINWVYKDTVPEDRLIEAIRPALVYYKIDRLPAESFGDFCHRKGKDDLLQFDAQYTAAPEPYEAAALDIGTVAARGNGHDPGATHPPSAGLAAAARDARDTEAEPCV